MVFSFAYLDDNHQKFGSRYGESRYVCKLVERLKAVCALSMDELLNNRSQSLRAHLIDFSQTAEPEGFRCLNAQFRQFPAYQFSISANKHGRVHGFIQDQTFHVVWLDPAHQLYPEK